MDNLDDFLMTRPPTANRPLLGLTVLAVEDSRFASEALRLLCLRSGARIRRADSLAHARRHLRVYRPSVVIVDLGLPDGCGEDLIRDLASASPRVDVILAISGDIDGQARAFAAGADGFLAKPIDNLGAFQTAILEHLPDDRQPPRPRSVTNETIEPDQLALRDDLTQIAALLDARQVDKQHLAGTVGYVTQFLTGLARTADDQDLKTALNAMPATHSNQAELLRDVAHLSKLVNKRIDTNREI